MKKISDSDSIFLMIIAIIFLSAVVFLYCFWKFYVMEELIKTVDILFLLVVLTLIGRLIYITSKIKMVFLEDNQLIVKGIFKQIVVEKWELKNVSQSLPFFRPRIVKVKLKWKTKFGFYFLYIPKGGFSFIKLYSNDLTKELIDWSDN